MWPWTSPAEQAGTVLVNEVLVVRLQGLNIWDCISLGVQIKLAVDKPEKKIIRKVLAAHSLGKPPYSFPEEHAAMLSYHIVCIVDKKHACSSRSVANDGHDVEACDSGPMDAVK